MGGRIAYNVNETKETFFKELKNPDTLYCAKCINWTGNIKNTKQRYTDFISKLLLENIDKYKINDVDRSKSYNVERPYLNITNTDNETNLSKKLLGITSPEIGIIFAYQTPLRETNKNKARAIDLLSVNAKEKTVYILELKVKKSKETMLRCVLESYTYKSIINSKKLLEDYYLPSEYKIVASPLVFANQSQYKEYQDCKNLRNLMTKLEVKPFFIFQDRNKKIIISSKCN